MNIYSSTFKNLSMKILALHTPEFACVCMYVCVSVCACVCVCVYMCVY